MRFDTFLVGKRSQNTTPLEAASNDTSVCDRITFAWSASVNPGGGAEHFLLNAAGVWGVGVAIVRVRGSRSTARLG